MVADKQTALVDINLPDFFFFFLTILSVHECSVTVAQLHILIRIQIYINLKKNLTAATECTVPWQPPSIIVTIMLV